MVTPFTGPGTDTAESTKDPKGKGKGKGNADFIRALAVSKFNIFAVRTASAKASQLQDWLRSPPEGSTAPGAFGDYEKKWFNDLLVETRWLDGDVSI